MTADSTSRRSGRFRLPILLQAPPDPIRTREIRFDERTTPARFTLRVIAGARRYTAPAALLIITHQIGEALVPVITGIAIERAVATGDLGQLLFWLAVLAADFAMLSFSWRFGSRIGELGMLAVQHQLRGTVARRLLGRTRESSARAADQPGVALSLATSDVNRLSHAVAIGVYPVGWFAAVVFGGTILLVISWPLGLAVLLGAPLVLWLTERAGRSLRDRSSEEQDSAAAASGAAADLMAGYRVVRGIGAEAEASERYRRASRRALSNTLRARRSEGVFGGTMAVVTGLFLTAIAVAAGLGALSGSLGLGELITVVGLTQFLLEPLQNLTKQAGSLWASATASAGRLLDLMRDEPGPENPASATVTSSGSTVLSEMQPGEIIAVAGERIAVEGLLETLRRTHPDAVVAPHATHLFTGTVRQNVALPGTDSERIEAALRAAGCEELVEALPLGYDTPVGENGTALSGGQRQRVALARALAQDADLLVLHDPTTAIDAVTEAAIAARLRGARGRGRTLILSRSPALVDLADRVLDLAADPAGGMR